MRHHFTDVKISANTVGGKIDIKEREVTSEEAETYASRHGLPYLEVSSKENGLGIQEVSR